MKKHISDRIYLAIFLVLDLIFLGAAYRYYVSLNDLTLQSLLRSQRHASSKTPDAQAESILDEIERQAKTGTWEKFEAARAERAAEIARSGNRLSPGVALYFYPETLPPHSFERDFANSELKPGLSELRTAYDTRNSSGAKVALEKLESRVSTYELGASEDSSEMSPEALVFLRTYRSLVTKPEPELNLRRPSSQRRR